MYLFFSNINYKIEFYKGENVKPLKGYIQVTCYVFSVPSAN